MQHLAEIFNHQRQLMGRFHHIEVGNLPELRDPAYTAPLDINLMRAQLRLKEYAWRVTEELIESKLTHDLEKAQEEVIDALHFMVEMFILLGLEADFFDVDPEPDFFVGDTFQTFLAKIGMTMNMLRFRPWKQTAQATDREKFLFNIRSCWFRFVDIFAELAMTPDDVYLAYIGKNKVNHERINDGV